MSWLLFLDESGHDHKQMPYEVRGGIALHVSKLWPFVRAVQQLELNAFGAELHLYKRELRGSTLLDRKRFKFAGQMPRMNDEERRKHCRAFLTKGLEKKTNQTQEEFTAYGQACLEMAEGIFQSLQDHAARLFATAVPRGADKPPADRGENLLRKDFVFLLERFYCLLEEKQEHGLLVLDEVEKSADRRFVRRLERYFSMSATGPIPFALGGAHAVFCVVGHDVCDAGRRSLHLLREPWVPPASTRHGRSGSGRNRRAIRRMAGALAVSRPRLPGRQGLPELWNCPRARIV